MTSKTQKKKPIYIIGGSKGGVGKSIVSIAFLHFFLEGKNKVLLIETDTSNPDVYKIYKDSTETKLINLDDKDGWIDLVNFSEQYSDHIILVNTAARNNEGTTNFGSILSETVEELNRELITLWVINRQRDSLELLKEYMEVIKNTKIHVLLNTYFGDPSKFELYHSSKIKKTIEQQDGKTLNFPDLADRVSDDIYSKRMTINEALTQMPIGNRAELNRWLSNIKKLIEEVING